MEMPGGGPPRRLTPITQPKAILAGSMGDRKVTWIAAERKGAEGPSGAFPLCYS